MNRRTATYGGVRPGKTDAIRRQATSDRAHMAQALRSDSEWLMKLAEALKGRRATGSEITELIGLARDLPMAATVLDRRTL